MNAATVTPYGRRLLAQARRIGVSHAWLRRHIRRGLVATFVGGWWYIRDEDVDRYLAARTADRLGATAAPPATCAAPDGRKPAHV